MVLIFLDVLASHGVLVSVSDLIVNKINLEVPTPFFQPFFFPGRNLGIVKVLVIYDKCVHGFYLF